MMTTYKLIVQREEAVGEIGTVFETIHELTSTNEAVVAASLRAIANQLDPPMVGKRVRDYHPSMQVNAND